MSNPVWILSVDLQSKTATFESGIAQAARSARASFGSISDDAKGMGDGVQAGATNVRAALGLIDNTIRGNHAAAMADLVREFSQTAIVMQALPFGAVIGGIAAVGGIAIEIASKIKDWREEQEKLNNEQTKLGTTAQNSLNTLNDKLLEAEKRSDELRIDHIGALRKEIELIDHASLSDLAKEFDVLAKTADDAFKGIQSHWQIFGIGAAGASHALEDFKTNYQALLSQGNEKGATDYLHSTLASAEKVIAAMKSLQSSRSDGGGIMGWLLGPSVDYSSQLTALATLKAAGLAGTKDELAAQQAIVEALRKQADAEAIINRTKADDTGNATRQESNGASSRRAAAARASIEAQQSMGEMVVAADKATADAQLEIQHASIQQRLDNDLTFAARDLAVKLEANQEEQARLNQAGDDYVNNLKELQNKALVIQQQAATQETELRARAAVAMAQQELETYEAGERAKIEATQTGSAARLAAIDAAIKEAQAKALQETDYYRQLGQQEIETVRQMADQETKIRLEALQAVEKVDLSKLAAQQDAANARFAAQNASIAKREQSDLAFATKEYDVQRESLEKQLQELEQFGEQYTEKKAEIQNKVMESEAAYQKKVTDIQSKADEDRQKSLRSAMASMEEGIGQSLLSMLNGHSSFAQQMGSIANGLAKNLMQAAVQEMNALDAPRLSQAKEAARSAYVTGEKVPFVGPVLGPTLAAAAFAGVMSFNSGTDMVPGDPRRGDVVPAALTPGEGVVPGGVMDGLRNVARNGGFNGGGQTVHVHVRPTYHVNTISGDGMKDVLEKHSDQLTKHFQHVVRKMNR